MNTAYYFFGGAADLFLSLMLWFILDLEKTPALFVDGDRVYAVTNVIGQNDSSSSINCDDEIQVGVSGRENSYVSTHSSFVSKRMIQQFSQI